MADLFQKPVDILTSQDTFSPTEVGITNPQTPSYVRLLDNGDLEIVCSEGLLMIMHKESRSITFVADHVKFLTKEDQGFRWNRLALNPKAVFYQEPAFLELQDEDHFNFYQGASLYYGG